MFVVLLGFALVFIALPAAAQGQVWAQRGALLGVRLNRDADARVAIEGSTLLVGAPADVDGQGRPGTVHVFERMAERWAPSATLSAPDGARGDAFGTAVALSSTRLVVGAVGHESGGTHLGGAVYVYARRASGLTLSAELISPDDPTDFGFGSSLATARDVIAVGDGYRDAVYVFSTDSAGWHETTIRSPLKNAGFFGGAVATDGSTLVVGAPLATLHGSMFEGAVYVYIRTGNTWTRTDRLTPQAPVGGDTFGRSVSMYNGVLAVGAEAMNGRGFTNPSPGYVDLYTDDVSGWAFDTRLTPTDGAPGDNFGASVSQSRDAVLVGAPNHGGAPGAVYEFTDHGGAWGQTALRPSEPAVTLGHSVAQSDGTAVVATSHQDPGTHIAYLFART